MNDKEFFEKLTYPKERWRSWHSHKRYKYNEFGSRIGMIPSYEDIVLGHKFEIVGAGRAPDGEYEWCAFCGGRLKDFIQIRRDDGKNFRIGSTCIGRVGLELTYDIKHKLLEEYHRKTE